MVLSEFGALQSRRAFIKTKIESLFTLGMFRPGVKTLDHGHNLNLVQNQLAFRATLARFLSVVATKSPQNLMYPCFASCPKGLESLLYEELSQLGVQQVKETVSGVLFHAPLEHIYRCCLWSRFASRIFLILGEFDAKNAQALYQAAQHIQWDKHFLPVQRFCVDFVGMNRAIENTQLGALKIKDAIVDFFQERYGYRPDVDKQNPDCRIHGRLHHGRLTLSLI